MGARRKGAVWALLLFSVVALPSPAEAVTQTLSPSGHDALGPQVAIDSDGDALVVWQHFDAPEMRIQGRTRSATGVIGPVRNLSAAGHRSTGAVVGMDADGDAVVVWERDDGTNRWVEGRTWSADGTLGPVRRLSGLGSFQLEPRVAVNPSGAGLVVWEFYNDAAAISRIQARSFSTGGVVGPPQTLSGSDRSAEDARVAIDEEGDALVAWRRDARIQTRHRAADGTLGPVESVSGPEFRTSAAPELTVDADGDALVVWSEQRPPGTRIRARARSKSGAWDTGPVISPANASDPAVAMDPDGDAVVAWGEWANGPGPIVARARPAAGTWGAGQQLADDDSFDPEVGLDAGGDALVVWGRGVGSWIPEGGFPSTRVAGRTRSAAGTLGPTLNISPEDAGGARLAVNADGDALVVFTWFDGSNHRVRTRPFTI